MAADDWKRLIEGELTALKTEQREQRQEIGRLRGLISFATGGGTVIGIVLGVFSPQIVAWFQALPTP